MKPHYITSRAELRQILSAVKLGSLSVDDAFASIDLTTRLQALALAEWIEKKAAEIREANKS